MKPLHQVRFYRLQRFLYLQCQKVYLWASQIALGISLYNSLRENQSLIDSKAITETDTSIISLSRLKSLIILSMFDKRSQKHHTINKRQKFESLSLGILSYHTARVSLNSLRILGIWNWSWQYNIQTFQFIQVELGLSILQANNIILNISWHIQLHDLFSSMIIPASKFRGSRSLQDLRCTTFKRYLSRSSECGIIIDNAIEIFSNYWIARWLKWLAKRINGYLVDMASFLASNTACLYLAR